MSGSDLVTNIFLDAAPFIRGANEAQAHASRLEGRMEEAAEHISHSFKHMGLEIAGAFGVGFGIERGIESIKGQIESINELSHLSERSGIDLNDLRALRFEAQHAGADVEGLMTSFTKFQKNMGEAAAHGAKRSVFQDLGLDPDSIGRLNPAEAFAKVGDAIAALENPTSRVHYAVELFGRSGAESLNVITKGSEGLHEALEKVGVLSEADVSEMKRVHEATIDLDNSWNKLARTAAINLAPAIGGIVEHINEAIAASEKLAKINAQNQSGVTHDADEFGGFETAEQILEARKAGFQRPGYDAAHLYDKGNDRKDPALAGFPIESPEMLEAKRARRGELGKEFDSDEMLAEQLREKGDPHIKYGQEQSEALGLYFKGHLDQAEMLNALDDARDHFKKAMDDLDPLKKLKEQAAHMWDGVKGPENKLEDTFAEIQNVQDAKIWNAGQAQLARDKAGEDYRKSQGVVDEKDLLHAPTHIQGPEAVADAGQAYSSFFRNLQPSTDTEIKKQTEIQEKNLAVNQQILAAQKQANQKPAPQVASIN